MVMGVGLRWARNTNPDSSSERWFPVLPKGLDPKGTSSSRVGAGGGSQFISNSVTLLWEGFQVWGLRGSLSPIGLDC